MVLTCAAAASMEASSVTSIWIRDTLPLMGRARRTEMASEPLDGSRLPRRMWYSAEERRRFLAVSKPMP